MGLIATLKKHYRRIMLERVCSEDFNSPKDFQKSIDMWTVACDLNEAWSKVKVKTIANAWAPLLKQNYVEDFERIDFSPYYENFTAEEIENWLHCDDDDPGFRLLNEEEILEAVLNQKDPLDLTNDLDENDEVGESNEVPGLRNICENEKEHLKGAVALIKNSVNGSEKYQSLLAELSILESDLN